MSSQTHSTGSQTQQSKQNLLENDLLLRALRREKVEKPPVWLMRQAGRFLPEYRALRKNYPDFLSLCKCPEATTELAMQPLRRFKLDAAIVFSDILTIPEALDIDLKFIPGKGPLISRPIQKPQDVDLLQFAEVKDKTSYVSKAVFNLRQALGNKLPIIGFAGSPWTLACYMINGSNFKNFQYAKQFAYEHPIATGKLIEQLSIVTGEYLCKQAESGADALFLIDTWGGLLPFTLYESYSLKPLEIIQKILKEKNIDKPILFYSKGYSSLHAKRLLEKKPCQGLAIDWATSIEQTYKDLSASFAIQGNIDPAVLLAGPVATVKHTHAMLETINPEQSYIASLGHGILPETPLDSISAFIDTVHSFTSIK